MFEEDTKTQRLTKDALRERAKLNIISIIIKEDGNRSVMYSD